MSTINRTFINKKNCKEEKNMMKRFVTRGSRKFVALVLAATIMLSGVVPSDTTKAEAAKPKAETTVATTKEEALDDFMFSMKKLPSKKGARYEYTFANIPSRILNIVDGKVTLEIDGAVYQLSLKQAVTDATIDQYGTVWMRYKNDALYYASYELEGKNITKHRLTMNNMPAYAESFLFKGPNISLATHYKDNNGAEQELPNIDYLRNLLGMSTPTPSPTATVAPTPSPTVTVTPTSTPNLIIDSTTTETSKTETNTEIDVKFWVNKYEKGEITWEQMSEMVKICSQVAKTEYDEITKTNYIYDANGNLIEKVEKKSGTKEEVINSTETTKDNTSGSANEEKKEETNGGAEIKETTTSTTEKESNTHIEVTDNRPSNALPAPSVLKKAAKVKISGSKIQWLDKNGKTIYTSFIKPNGNFKLKTLKGKKVVSGGFIEKGRTYILKIKGGTQYAVNLKNYKVTKLDKKALKYFRNDRNFITHVILKNGKKVNISKLKVKKGQYTLLINNVKHVTKL